MKVDAGGWDEQVLSELTEVRLMAAERGFPTDKLAARIGELAGELARGPN